MIDHNTLHGLNQNYSGNNNALSSSGKTILTCRPDDWRYVDGPNQVKDTVVKNDDVAILYSRSRGNALQSYAIMNSPYQYEVIVLRDLGITALNATYIRDIVWSGTRWVMVTASSTSLYIVWSDNGRDWNFPPNNPTGQAVATLTNLLISRGNVRMAKGTADDELMLIYADLNVNSYKSVHTTTSFDVDDLADETVSASPPQQLNGDQMSALLVIGSTWILFYINLYNTSSTITKTPFISVDNGVNWTQKSGMPATSSETRFYKYNIVGDTLLVHTGEPITGARIMYYTKDFCSTWTKIQNGERAATGAAHPVAKGYPQGSYGGFMEMEELDGVFYDNFQWLNPITATSGTTGQEYITGFTKASIEDFDGTNAYLRHVGFNAHTKNEDNNGYGTQYHFYGENFFYFQKTWLAMSTNNGQAIAHL